MARPFVQLMGRAGVQTGAGWTDFVPERRFQLLAYLAYARDWVARDQLAHLFWPSTSTQTARGNLRSLLERVRDLPWLTGLESERHRVRWLVTTDVEALEAGLARVERAADWSSDDAGDVAALSTGPLLAGMEGYDDSEFATWLELERGHLQGRCRAALLSQVERAAGRDEIDGALGLLDRLLAVDRLDEEVVQRYLAVARARTWRDRALRVYREFARHLDRELGLAPAEATQHLARSLDDDGADAAPLAAAATSAATQDDRLDGGHVPSMSSRSASSGLPVPPTSFVGRRGERAEIARLLARPECRLLTLVGPGGVGKTRLAQNVVHDLQQRYPGGVFVVGLEALSAPEAIPARIAEALGPTTPGDGDPLDIVAARFGTEPVLLVLDDFEHLLAGADALSALSRRCPGLDMVVTSRERLNLVEEWILSVDGLPFPEGPVGAEAALAFEAVQLFVERARRYVPGWTLADADAPAVARICRVLEGTPLAIELAAVWVRVMSSFEIAQELESNVDFLATAARNAPGRHGSIRATFEHSWRLLNPVEQDGLRALAVFRGGVTREAVAAVAGVQMPVLAALVDKSLVRVSSGRYDAHRLLEQFAREKLAAEPELERKLSDRHAEFYLRLLIEWGARLEGPQGDRARAMLEAELGNVLSAWRRAIRNLWLRELHVTTPPLQRFFAQQERGREGAEVFGQLVAALSDAEPEHRAALGYALLSHGYFLPPGHAERVPVLRSGLALLGPLEAGTGVLWGLYVLGLSATATGGRAEAQRYLEEVAALAIEQGDDRARADCLTNLARLAQDGGDYAAAIEHARAAVEIWRALHDTHGEAWALTWWGLAALRSDQRDDAEVVIERASRLARERGDALQTTLLTAHRGLLQLARGSLELARSLHLEALAIEIGPAESAYTKPMLLADLARVEIARGDLEAAQDRLHESLESSEPHGWAAHMSSAIAALAAVHATLGRQRSALELAFLVLRHDASEHVHHEQMRALVESLRTTVDGETLEAARARAQDLRLEEVARAFVDGRATPS